MTLRTLLRIAPRATAPPAQSAPAAPCRNCGAIAAGNYCAQCGQETRVALPTLREFMREATGRIVAFDGRMWRTLHALAFRPGALTKAYLAGRRRFYVRPARLFLAMSLILFAVIRFEVGSVKIGEGFVVMDSGDDVTRLSGKSSAGTSPALKNAAPAAKPDAPVSDEASPKNDEMDGVVIAVDGARNFTVQGITNPYLRAQIEERFDRFNKLSQQRKAEQLLDGALRYGSYVIFLLLPVFAVLQYISYLGRMRRYAGRPKLYAEHLVYSAHLHTFWFLIAIIALVVPWNAVRWGLAAWMLYYIARSKQAVYGGSWWGRVLRSLFVVVTYFIAVCTGLVALLFVSILIR